MAPMLWPWRSLKLAMDLRALVTTGFCPVMAESCSSEASRILPFWMASPSPMFTTTLSSRGACMGFLNPNSFIRAGRTSCSNLCFSRAAMCLSLLPALVALLAGPDAPSVLAGHVRHPGGLPALRAHHHHVRHVDRAGLLDDAAVRVRLAAPLLEVALHRHELLHADPVRLPDHVEDLAGLALLPAGQHLHGVVLVHVHDLE